jgi:hypothetical protein
MGLSVNLKRWHPARSVRQGLRWIFGAYSLHKGAPCDLPKGVNRVDEREERFLAMTMFAKSR